MLAESAEKKRDTTDVPFSTVFLAQRGDADAMNYLWESCVPYVNWLAAKMAPYSFEESRWCQYDDLIQCGYLAFRTALDKWRPVEGAQFKAYFGVWLKEYFRRELGISNSRRKEILKDCRSLYETLLRDEDSDEFIQFEEDERAREAFELIEEFDFSRVVREQVEKLPEPERQTVKDFHFKGLMLKTIAKNLGVAPTSTSRYLDNAYQMLRKNKIIQVLYAEIRFPELNPYEKISLRAFKIDRMSLPEWDYIAREAFREDLAKIFCGKEVDYESTIG